MDIIFKGRRTDVQERFRRHASAKLGKIERLGQQSEQDRCGSVHRAQPAPVRPARAGRTDDPVRVARSSGRKRRPTTATRRSTARWPNWKHGCGGWATGARTGIALPVPNEAPRIGPVVAPPTGQPVSAAARVQERFAARARRRAGRAFLDGPFRRQSAVDGAAETRSHGRPRRWRRDDVIPIQMEGDGPVVVREKFHAATPMSIDQALLEMELVGTRLLPVPGRGLRPCQRRLPPSRVSVRFDPPGRAAGADVAAAASPGSVNMRQSGGHKRLPGPLFREHTAALGAAPSGLGLHGVARSARV